MPNETKALGLRYPSDSEAPNGPQQLGTLAEDAEAALLRAGAQAKKSIITAEQSRENASYGTLGTADEVKGIVLPTDGVIFALFHARWISSVSGAGRAAIFLGANQLKVARLETGVVTEAATSQGVEEGGKFGLLTTFPAGLVSASGIDTGAEVTTGQALGVGIGGTGKTPSVELEAEKVNLIGSTGAAFYGGICAIFAEAGEYALSVRFKATSGKVTAKNRKLWVWTKAFI